MTLSYRSAVFRRDRLFGEHYMSRYWHFTISRSGEVFEFALE
jgi:hypothetical protein